MREYGRCPSMELLEKWRAPHRRKRTEQAEDYWEPEIVTKPIERKVEPTPQIKAVYDTLADEVIAMVSDAFMVNASDIVGGLRWKNLVDARCVIAVILSKQGRTLNQIGRKLGCRDHSTISSSIERYEKMKAENPLIERLRNEIEAKIMEDDKSA